jgi:predicted negative regulator of RcsB-dependent stress response
MYCPECGEDAQDAKYCPECGADLRGLASAPVCETCGSDVPAGAKFCPDCGEARDAGSVASEATRKPGAAGGRRTGTRGRGGGTGRAQQRRQAPPRREEPAPRAAAADTRTFSPAVIWGGFGLLAVIIVLIVVFAVNGGGDSTSAAAPDAAQSVQPVSADTSGSYDQLVERANGLYDEGSAAFGSEQWDQGAEYFAAAAEVYAAAWKKKATDPNVGTDFATSLFYSGAIDAAIAQVEKVLAQSPGFQTGWFNLGNYWNEQARHAEQDGDAKAAEAAYDEARTAFEKAVSLGEGTPSGQQAQARLDELPQ